MMTVSEAFITATPKDVEIRIFSIYVYFDWGNEKLLSKLKCNIYL